MEHQLEAQQYAAQNFDLPHDIVQLPSQGVFYKSKRKSVKIGYLTATDENIILNGINNPNKEGVILSLIKAKLYESDLRPEELINGDVEAILIFLRNTSFGPTYTFNLTDPKTDESFQQSISLEELDFLKPEQLPDESGLYSIILPKSGIPAKIKPLTFSEVLDINNQVENYPQGRTVPRVTWRLEKQIVELDGNADKSKISSFIPSMPMMDSKFIRNFLAKNEPQIDLSRTVTTPSGEKVNVNITFGVEFFRPFF